MRAVAMSALTARSHVPIERRVGNLGRRDLQPLDLQVLREKHLSEKPAIVLQVVSRKIHRLALDEILHRIGGDQAGVVTLGVGFPERLAVEDQQDVGAEHREPPVGASVPVEAIRNDIAFAVVVALGTACESVHEITFLQPETARCGTPAAALPGVRYRASRGADVRARSEYRASCCPSRRIEMETRTSRDTPHSTSKPLELVACQRIEPAPACSRCDACRHLRRPPGMGGQRLAGRQRSGCARKSASCSSTGAAVTTAVIASCNASSVANGLFSDARSATHGDSSKIQPSARPKPLRSIRVQLGQRHVCQSAILDRHREYDTVPQRALRARSPSLAIVNSAASACTGSAAWRTASCSTLSIGGRRCTKSAALPG